MDKEMKRLMGENIGLKKTILKLNDVILSLKAEILRLKTEKGIYDGNENKENN